MEVTLAFISSVLYFCQWELIQAPRPLFLQLFGVINLIVENSMYYLTSFSHFNIYIVVTCLAQLVSQRWYITFNPMLYFI